MQTVEGELHTRSICHYHAHHCQSLTLLSQSKINEKFL
ncbi:hypothetical protein GXM_03638 [Nostoc sphaeroides CCNUC1]|uniref:Uncharacterized protein n=1 Tax=Nostoc sphaeroides CCNUC1 TaxID=2653204 RepID=A0A5P8W0C3_9NOSO|nr:hypothetical protein GXM_03638 [Nostoc sphaeroides CCNUC1]